MTKLARHFGRLAEKSRKKPLMTSKEELSARWIYNNARIEYPEVRLKDARKVVREK
jgi:hypothetical protein